MFEFVGLLVSLMNLRTAHLFAALDDDQIKRILETSQTITLNDGQLLFESGEDAERFFLILGGQMKLYRLSSSGDEKIIVRHATTSLTN